MAKNDVFRGQKIRKIPKWILSLFPPLYYKSLANPQIQMKFSHS